MQSGRVVRAGVALALAWGVIPAAQAAAQGTGDPATRARALCGR
jgi:hypothetical protein